MATVELTTAPALGRVANVELVHTGTWALSTGETTFTVDDLLSAVAALDCPAVRRPILKLGHTPQPQPGQPATGFIGNLAVAENGHTLVGDYVGVPGWLVVEDEQGQSVITSAYPDRSIEGVFDFRCQLGHTHPFVLTAVALLGQDMPGVGTIQSLQDLAALYGVAAGLPPPDGTPVAFTVHAVQEARMPNPSPVQVAAAVTTEDVRRAFYASPAGAGWDKWIEEMQLDPLQLIVVDDASGTRVRVPVNVGDGDGEAAVSFSDPVTVVIRYEDTATANAAAGAPRGRPAVRYRTKAESRPDSAPPPTNPHTRQPGARTDVASAAARIHNATKRGAGSVAHDPAKLREAFGLNADATDEEVRAAVTSAGLASPTPPAAPAVGDTTTDAPPVSAPSAHAATSDAVILDPAQYAALRAQAMRGDEAWRKMRETECEQILDDAIKAGKFPPARREHWKTLWAADPDGTKATIEKLAANVIPVLASGFPGVGDEAETDIVYAQMYPDTKVGVGRG